MDGNERADHQHKSHRGRSVNFQRQILKRRSFQAKLARMNSKIMEKNPSETAQPEKTGRPIEKKFVPSPQAGSFNEVLVDFVLFESVHRPPSAKQRFL